MKDEIRLQQGFSDIFVCLAPVPVSFLPLGLNES